MPDALRRTIFLAAVTLPVGGCSLLIDTDGLSQSTDETNANANDASTAADGVAIDDASEDANANANDAGAPSLCDDAGALCDDFDHGLLGERWSGTDAVEAVLRLGNGLSQPNAMEAKLSASNTESNAFLFQGFEPGTKLGCDFDMRVDSSLSGSEIDVFAFDDTGENPRQHTYYAALTNDSWMLGEYAVRNDGSRIDRWARCSAPARDRWVHVRVEHRGTELSVAFDGDPAGKLTELVATSATRRDFSIGVTFAAAKASGLVSYDNVRCEKLR